MLTKYDPKTEKDVEIAGQVEVDPFEALVKEEADHDVGHSAQRLCILALLTPQIKYRTMSWQKTALLLFGEYVCLAILALSWSWSVLGWVRGYSKQCVQAFHEAHHSQVAGAFITAGMGLVTWCKLIACLAGEEVDRQTPRISSGNTA